MKRGLRRALKILGLTLAVLVVAAVALGWWFVRRPWPQVKGEVTAPGLGAAVEVIRDRWGIPHIYAAHEADLYMAQGFVHAQDRLWQMEFNRRIAAGRLGETLGPPLLDADRFLRTLGLRRAAEADWAVLGAEARAALEAYARGVNLYLETHRGRLPLEFTLLGVEPEPWTPVDSLSWGKLMGLTLSLNHPSELLRRRIAEKLGEDAVGRLLPPYPAGGPVIVPGADAAATMVEPREALWRRFHPALAPLLAPGAAWASNNWVVAGTRTAGGAPILGNDTHLGLGMPSVWYENGLHGGRIDAVGFSFPGMPLVVIGHNGRIAWGITNMCSDVQDFFIERLDDPEEPRRYEYQGAWRDLEVTTESIPLKGAEPATLTVRRTHHGPLMNDVMEELAEAPPMALAWTSLEGGPLVEGLLGVNLAGSWEELRQALSLWDSPSVNFGYADAAGNIGYQSTGRIPIRAPGHRGLAPVAGWDGEHEWQGFIPFAELPSVLNPTRGFLVTANNKVVADDYPYHLAYDMADPYRARRMTDVLAADESFTLEDAQALQADLRSLPAAELVPYLLAVEPESGPQRRAQELLEGWDFELRADSPAAAVYETWVWFLWSRLLEDELGEELMADYRALAAAQMPLLPAILARPDDPWIDDVTTPETETREEVVRASLAAAVAWLEERQGADPRGWEWGRLHPAVFRHAPLGASGIGILERIFNGPSMPVGGDTFTVDEATPGTQERFASTFGVSQRLIVDLGDLESSLAVNSTGQSGHAFHRHRADQTPLWQRVEYHPLPFGREAVDAAAESTLTLRPE